MRHLVMLRSADASAPAQPVGLQVVTGASSATLTWDASADPAGGSGLKDYVVYRNGVQLATVPTTPGLSLDLVGGDVGTFVPAGSSSSGGASYTVTGAGDQIYNTADQFRYVAAQVSGDCAIYAYVAAFESASNGFSKAGLMFRESLAANAAFVHCMSFPFAQGNGVKVEYRPSTGASTTQPGSEIGLAAVPRWLKLTRVGNLFTAYYSTGGAGWTLLGSATVTLSSTCYVGLAVGSESPGNPVSAQFQHVAVTNSPQVTYTDNAAPNGASYAVSARDVAGNESSLSTAVVGGSTTFRNWPTMLVHWMQGNTTNGADTTLGRSEIAKVDIAVLQGKWRSAHAQDFANITAIKGIRPGIKLAPYIDTRFYQTAAPVEPDNYTRWLYEVVVSGPSGWRARDASGTGLAHRFNASGTLATNPAVHLAGTRSGDGKRLSQAMAAQHRLELTDQGYNRIAFYDGTAFDDYNVKDEPKYADGSSATPDYEQDGTPDNVDDNAGGGAKFRTGMATLLADFKAEFPSFFTFANTDVGFHYAQSVTPPRPITSNEMAKAADLWLCENSFSYRFRIGEHDNHSNDHIYPIRAGITLHEGWMEMAMHAAGFSKSDTESPFGRRCYSMYQLVACRSDNTEGPDERDFAFARFCLAVCLSVEGAAYGLNFSGADRPFPIDERCLKLGAPLATRSMGTLNQGGQPVTFSLRAADVVGAGGAQFYFTEFVGGLVVMRYDTIGINLSTGNHGDGAAVGYSLPPGSWRRPNAATYVHPDYPDLAMTGQNTTLNNGAVTVSASSLKPLHAEFFLRN